MSFKNRAILFSRTFSCANHSNSRGLYIRAGALRENKTHAKISWTKVYDSLHVAVTQGFIQSTYMMLLSMLLLHKVLYNQLIWWSPCYCYTRFYTINLYDGLHVAVTRGLKPSTYMTVSMLQLHEVWNHQLIWRSPCCCYTRFEEINLKITKRI